MCSAGLTMHQWLRIHILYTTTCLMWASERSVTSTICATFSTLKGCAILIKPKKSSHKVWRIAKYRNRKRFWSISKPFQKGWPKGYRETWLTWMGKIMRPFHHWVSSEKEEEMKHFQMKIMRTQSQWCHQRRWRRMSRLISIKALFRNTLRE